MCEIMIRSYYFGALTIDQCSNLINKISLHAMCGFLDFRTPWGDFSASHPPVGSLPVGFKTLELWSFGALELKAMNCPTPNAMTSQRPPPVSLTFDSSKLFWNSSCCSRFDRMARKKRGEKTHGNCWPCCDSSCDTCCDT